MVDIEALGELLREVARTELLPRYGDPAAQDVRQKSGALDLVTTADLAAEARIEREAARLLPGALFVGEESVAARPALLDLLRDAELALVVDPLDGTYNFAAGIPLFGVIAAVVRRGECIAGVLYDPMGDDQVYAELGAGAYRRHPDGRTTPLRGPAPLPLSETTGIFSASYLAEDVRKRIYANLHRLRFSSSYRCAAHEYRMFANGYTQFLVYNKLMPWDHLAGTLICAEVGAHVARFDGSPYRPGDIGGGLIVAPDMETWRALREQVFTVD